MTSEAGSDADHITTRAGKAAFASPILSPKFRAPFVEAMVYSILPGGWQWHDAAWDEGEFSKDDGTSIRALHATALQPWWDERYGDKVKTPLFRTDEGMAGYARGNKWEVGPRRYPSIYIFAYHGRTDSGSDQRDPAQWDFYVVPSSKIPHRPYRNCSGRWNFRLDPQHSAPTVPMRMISLMRVQMLCTRVGYSTLLPEIEKCHSEIVAEWHSRS